jgi:hypothetical protein
MAISKGIFDVGEEESYDDVVLNHEVRLSQEVLSRGWNLNCLVSEYKDIDYRVREKHLNDRSDPCYKNGCFGRTISIYETVFIKTHRDICDDSLMKRIGEVVLKGEDREKRVRRLRNIDEKKNRKKEDHATSVLDTTSGSSDRRIARTD